MCVYRDSGDGLMVMQSSFDSTCSHGDPSSSVSFLDVVPLSLSVLEECKSDADPLKG